MLNFTSKKATANTGIITKNAKVLINNYGGKSSTTELRPYEAVVLELK
jgi:oligo-1,6-glucosidase